MIHIEIKLRDVVIEILLVGLAFFAPSWELKSYCNNRTLSINLYHSIE